MKSVNFLEKKRFNTDIWSLNYLWVCVIIGIFFLLVFSFWLIENYRLRSLEQERVAMMANVDQLKKQQGSQRAQTFTKEDTLKLLNHPILWSLLLKNIALYRPASIQITRVSGSLLDKRLLVILGQGQYANAIVDFKKHMAKWPECQKTELTSLEQQQDPNQNGRYIFQVECALK